MLFSVDQVWDGKDAFIIGGGPSLSGFNFDRLRGSNVIGCNSAWRLGESICPIVFFGDQKWWEKWGEEILNSYTGKLVSYHPWTVASRHPQIYGLSKSNSTIKPGHIGWFQNSGASAIHLACMLGAKRIYLLGFDMQLGPKGQNNYHTDSVFPAREEVYAKFKAGFERLAERLPDHYPDAEIYNLNPDSALEVFPKVRLEAILPTEEGDDGED